MVKKCHMNKHTKGAAWFDTECREAKRESKGKLRKFRKTRKPEDRKDYADSNKSYRRLTRIKKKEFKRNKAALLATNLKNASVFWKELKSLGGEKKSNASDKIYIDVWYDHFKNILGHTANETIDESNVQEQDVSEETNHSLNQEISVDEVQKAVTNLKSGKACGLDHIHAEMLKMGGKDVILFMTKLFNTIFDKGIYPSDWAKAIIVPIHKKGDIHLADNYRGVSLLSIVSKCYTSILNTRLYNWLEENDKIVEMQAGFRRNYSTTDQIFNLYAITQKCLNKKGQKLYVAFVDFKKAFDSVHHDKLLQAMQKEGVQGKFFASIKSMYDSLLSCVRANGEYSDFIFFIVPLVSARGVY